MNLARRINELRKLLALSLSGEGAFRANVLQGLLHSELLNWLPECGFCSDDEAVINWRSGFGIRFK
jgi:hypothetical protein